MAAVRDHLDADRTFLTDPIGEQIGHQERAADEERHTRERMRTLVAQSGIRMRFQPIVDLRTRTLVGAEALARFDCDLVRSPDRWFREAWAAGLGIDLEILAVRSALAQLPQFPADPSRYMSHPRLCNRRRLPRPSSGSILPGS